MKASILYRGILQGAVIFLFLYAASGCKDQQNKKPNDTKQEIKENFNKVISSTRELLISIKDAGYNKKRDVGKDITVVVDKLNKRFEKFDQYIKERSDPMKERTRQTFDNARIKLDNLNEKRKLLGDISDENWDEFRENLIKQIEELEKDLEVLNSKNN